MEQQEQQDQEKRPQEKTLPKTAVPVSTRVEESAPHDSRNVEQADNVKAQSRQTPPPTLKENEMTADSPLAEVSTSSTTEHMAQHKEDKNDRVPPLNGVPRRPRKKSLDELSNSSDELFEDEPDKSLPRPSPNRLAARLERRRISSRKQKHPSPLVSSEKPNPPSLAKVGLPHLHAFRKESRKGADDDDNSSHWSSSDGEQIDEGLRNAQWLSRDDIEICRRLDEEYERALEEREVVYTARYNSVRQSACFSVFFMLLYLTLGTIFFMRQAKWTVSESVFFSIYTITTVGYGRMDTPIPQTAAFQLYTIFFIFVGIAGITLMVAQTYQCIALEASRAEHSREQAQLARHRAETLVRSGSPSMAATSSEQNGIAQGRNSTSPRLAQQVMTEMNIPTHWIDKIFGCLDKTKTFLNTTEVGRSISVVLPFMGLILVGAMVVGPLEGWGFVESLYFAVVSLTTVGFGDYVPTSNASIVFCIIWLPCSIGFMSLFLTNVAAFYIRLSDRNIERIERHLRKRVKVAKEIARRERDAAKRRALRGQGLQSTVPAGDNGDDGSDAGVEMMNNAPGDGKSVDSDTPEEAPQEGEAGVHLFGSPDLLGEEVATRREKILMNFRGQWEKDDGAESDGSGDSLLRKGKGLATMKDMLRAVHANMPKESSSVFRSHGPEQEILSVRSNRFLDSHSLRQGTLRKPSFALRALVQERFAEIIAAEVAGFESSIEIKENTLRVTIGSLRQTASKWMIPRRARRAFRAVAFEALYFVGEHGLITRGADALFDLSPMEFHRLFTPLLAALGDADSMEAWLATTDILSEVDLKNGSPSSPQAQDRGTGTQTDDS